MTNDYELEVLLDHKRRFKVTAVQDNVVGTNRGRKVTIKRLITMESEKPRNNDRWTDTENIKFERPAPPKPKPTPKPGNSR